MHKTGIIIITAICISCQSEFGPKIENTLEIAAENKEELIKVLRHYKNGNDSLKLEAALFLVKNMRTHYTFGGEGLKVYDAFFKKMNMIWDGSSLVKQQRIMRTESIADSMKILQTKLVPQFDAQIVRADELISNIDLAFYAWRKFPWSTHNVSFEDFCNYILPYKIYTEPIQPWRETIIQEFSWLVDSLKNPTDIVEATSLVNRTVADSMEWIPFMMKLPNAVSFQNMRSGKIGKCNHKVTLNLYYLRALGIPAKADNVPLWGNRELGHSWCSIRDKNGKLFSFDAIQNSLVYFDSTFYGVYDAIPRSVHYNCRAPKIYRSGYQETQFKEDGAPIPVSELFEDKLVDIHSQDVTAEYDPKPRSISLNIKGAKGEVYLSVYADNQWKVIIRGESGSEGIHHFKNIGHNIVYLPVVLEEGLNQPVHNPIIVKASGEVQELSPKLGFLSDITVDRKYYFHYDLGRALRRMVGGIFQGSNDVDFIGADTLAIIANQPEPRTNTYQVKTNKKYRFVRFLLPEDHCRVAELKFISEENQEGDLISSSFQSINPPQNVLDANVLSYFVSEDNTGGWVGVDFGPGNEQRISEIQFYPPNDGNSVEIGDVYELSFWNGRWTSLGIQKARQEAITFNDCPGNALYKLDNLTKGKQVRVFTYENDQQVWW